MFNLSTFDILFCHQKDLGFGHIVLVYLSDGNISLGNIIWYMLEETS